MSRGRCSTRCTSAPSPLRARGLRRRSSSTSWRRPASPSIEMMPVADFPGRFGWGYDGVDLFAPTRLYGRPDDLRRFVDRAHARGLGVILDVVYNHLGPDGSYLEAFSADYFTDRYENEWGDAINFDGPDAGPGARVLPRQRRLLDRRVPLRRPAARRHPGDLRRLARAHPRARSAPRCAPPPGDSASCWSPRTSRRTPGRFVRPAEGGLRARRAVERRLPPQRPGRPDRPQRGVLHRLPRGSRRSSSRRRSTATSTRGSGTPGSGSRAARPPAALRRAAFVDFLENHDQVANSGRGPARAPADEPRALSRADGADAARPGHADAVPGAGVRGVKPVPVLRRPRAASWPAPIREGRAGFLAQFPVPRRPGDAAAPRRPGRGRDLRAVPARLLRARAPRADLLAAPRPAAAPPRRPGLSARSGPAAWTARCLAPDAFVLRFFGPGGHDEDRLLLVNLGRGSPASAPRPSRCSPRRRAVAGRCSGRAKTRHTTAAARLRSRRPTECASRARRRSCWPGGRPPSRVSHAADQAARSPGRALRGPAPGRARVAGDQRPGRVRHRHDRRRPHAAVPRRCWSRRCPAPFGRMVMLNHVGETLLPDGGGRVPLSTIDLEAGLADPEAPACLEEFGSRMGCRSGATGTAASWSRSGCSCPTARTRRTSRYRLLAGSQPSTLELRLFVHFRRHEGAVSAILGAPYTVTAMQGQFELSAPDVPPLRLIARGRARLHGRVERRGRRRVPRGAGARLPVGRQAAGAPGSSRVAARRRPGGDLDRVDRGVGGHPRAAAGRRSTGRGPPARTARGAGGSEIAERLRRANWCSRPTSSSSSPRGGPRRPRAPARQGTRSGP